MRLSALFIAFVALFALLAGAAPARDDTAEMRLPPMFLTFPR